MFIDENSEKSETKIKTFESIGQLKFPQEYDSNFCSVIIHDKKINK